MNLEKALTDLLHPTTVEKVKDKDATFEMKKLQQQMRQHALKEKKPCSQYFNYSQNTTFDTASMNVLVDKEIDVIKTKKGWKGLPKSIQWDLITTYFDSEEFIASLPNDERDALKIQVRTALVGGNKALNISYDAKLQKVTKVSV